MTRRAATLAAALLACCALCLPAWAWSSGAAEVRVGEKSVTTGEINAYLGLEQAAAEHNELEAPTREEIRNKLVSWLLVEHLYEKADLSPNRAAEQEVEQVWADFLARYRQAVTSGGEWDRDWMSYQMTMVDQAAASAGLSREEYILFSQEVTIRSYRLQQLLDHYGGDQRALRRDALALLQSGEVIAVAAGEDIAFTFTLPVDTWVAEVTQ